MNFINFCNYILVTYNIPKYEIEIDEYLSLNPDHINNKLNNYETPLMIAVANLGIHTSLNTIKILLKYNPNLYLTNEYDETALQILIDLSKDRNEFEDVLMLFINNYNTNNIYIKNEKLLRYLYKQKSLDNIIYKLINLGFNKMDIISERLLNLIQL